MSRKQESGQVFVLAALSMMVLIGIAAFCINASMMFYQHQRMQAQVDEQTRLAAGFGKNCTYPGFNGSFDNGNLVIVPAKFFDQEGTYCKGTYNKPAKGLFGNILRFPNNINVQAVAQHGGTTEVPFTFLGLSLSGDNQGCSVAFNNNTGMTVYSDVLANSSDSSRCGVTNATYASGSSYVTSANMLDPYQATGPVTGTVPYHCTSLGGGCSINTTCLATIPSGKDYYQPSSLTNNQAVAEVTSISSSNNDHFVYLPYCQDSTHKIPGVYLIDKEIKQTGGETDVISSTLVLSTSVTGSNVTVNGGNINWSSPDTGIFKGYALYQETTTTCPSLKANLAGGSASSLDGLVDLACTELTFAGGGAITLNASFVGWTIGFTGGAGGKNINPPTFLPARGAFLVQ